MSAQPNPSPAYTVRAEWTELPIALRDAIENRLGAAVESATNQNGGFSPGLAARIRCVDGRRAFVKAVGTPQNPDSPGMHRREAKVAAALPSSVPTPRWLFTVDERYGDDEWVAVGYEEIDGTMPATPWREDQLALVMDMLVELARTLTPTPLPELRTAREALSDPLLAYRRLLDDPPDDLDPWERRHLVALAEVSEGSLDVVDGDTLVHYDMRADNLLITPDRQVRVVDWPHAMRGAHWLDVAGFVVNMELYGQDPEALLTTSPLVDGVPREHITGFAAGLAGMWAERSRRPAPAGLPTVRAFQRAQNEVTLRWLQQRTGWE